MDGPGNLYIVDSYNDRIRRVDAATGLIATIVEELSGGEAAPATATIAVDADSP